MNINCKKCGESTSGYCLEHSPNTMKKNNMAEGEEFMKKFTEITGAKFVDVTPKTELDFIEEKVREIFNPKLFLTDRKVEIINPEILDDIVLVYRQEITKLLEKKREELCKEIEKSKNKDGLFIGKTQYEYYKGDVGWVFNQGIDEALQIIKSKI